MCSSLLDSDPDKHYLMYEHERVPIAVCEKEPSSIIAFALRYYEPFLYICVFLSLSVSYLVWGSLDRNQNVCLLSMRVFFVFEKL